MYMHIYVQARLNVFLSGTFFCVGMDRTNCSTNGTITGTGKWDFYLMMVILYAAIIAYTAVVLSLVVAANGLRATIRFVLTNILVASIITSFGIALICLHELITSISHLFSSSDVSIQIFLAVLATGGNGSSSLMAVFAVVVVVIMKCSNSAVKFKYLIGSVVVVWIACVAVGAILFVPGVVDRTPIRCSVNLVLEPGNKIWIFSTLYFLFFVIIPCTLATVMPVYALCYIRSNLTCENTQSLKPMLKFTLFLLLGNGLGFFGNFLGTAGSLIIKSVNTDVEVTRVLRVVYNVSLALSLIPTPILILVYFKPVRIQMRKCVLKVCGKWCRKCLQPSKQDPMTEMMLASPAVDND